MKLEPLDDARRARAAPEPPRPPVTLAPAESLGRRRGRGRRRTAAAHRRRRPTPLTAVTVPDMGARSVVAASAFSALVTLSCALSRLACAAATVMVLVAPPEPDPAELVARALRRRSTARSSPCGVARRGLGRVERVLRRLQARLGLREVDVGRVGVDLGQDLVLGDVLARLDVDVGDLAAGGEVDVGLVGGLEVAAARDRRLDHAARDGDRPLLSAGGRRRADDGDRAHHRGGGQRGERDGGEGGPASHVSSRSCSSCPGPAAPARSAGAPRKSTPHFCSAARSFWNCAEPGPFGPPWPEGGRRLVPVGGWPSWPSGGPPLPRGRLGTVTPCFFRHATTLGSWRKPRRPLPG